jgi:hypothetical protein
MKNIAKMTVLVSALSLLAVLPVSALSLPTDVVGAVSGSGNGSSDIHVSGSAHAGAGVNVDVSGQGSGYSSGNSTSSETSGANTSGGVSVTGGTDLSIPLVVSRADIDSNAIVATSVSSSKVVTKEDLSGYVAEQVQKDKNISVIDTASDHVALTYKEPAKLFGIVPFSIDTTATVDQSGDVTISYPWWNYLVTTDSAGAQARVQNNVNAALGANATASGLQNSSGFSAAEQAKLVAGIKAAMAAELAAHVSVSAKVSPSPTGAGD